MTKRNVDLADLETINTSLKRTFENRKKLWKETLDLQIRWFKENYYVAYAAQQNFLYSRDDYYDNTSGYYVSIYAGNTTLRLAQQRLIDELDLYVVHPLTGVVNRLVTWIDWPTNGWAVYAYIPPPRRRPEPEVITLQEELEKNLCIAESP